jgi:alanine racemase
LTDRGRRWAWAEVDLGAIAHNIAVLREAAAPAAVWAVVKADGYGHGAAPVARAALDAGAGGLCVALTSEGIALRSVGIVGVPILVLSEQPAADAADIVGRGLIPTVYSTAAVDALAAAARAVGVVLPVHVKVDTGMHRVGAAPDALAGLVAQIASHRSLRVSGVYTHLAVADEPDRAETAEQIRRLDEVLADVFDDVELPGGVHAANSAATFAHPASRRSFVRAGIAMYGISPGPGVDPLVGALRPALSLKARVSHVKRLAAGERLSYGLRHELPREATVATVPLGYADGVRRNLSGTATAALVGGRRREIIGTITMDQLMVDCGDDRVAVGDEVVLIGRQGDEQIRAEEWASALGTIGYEIVCGIGPRVPRRYVDH